MMARKRGVSVMACGDFHSGHRVGLTPPGWHEKLPVGANIVRRQYSEARTKLWNIFAREVRKLKRPDVLIANADLIDGRGEKSGGTELIATDRNEQADMAAEVIRFIGAPTVLCTYGTPYHTGNKEDWEQVIVDKLRDDDYKPKRVEIKSHLYTDINGVMFDVKHKIAGSTVPHGRHTPGAKENLWNLVWNEYTDGAVPRGDIFLRSHVHYYQIAGDGRKMCMTLPALAGMGSKYGARACSGLVTWGFVMFDIRGKGDYTWELVEPSDVYQAQKIHVVKV